MPLAVLEMEIKHIALPGDLTLAYVDEGSGTPLLFIHGMASHLHVWKRNIPDLASSYRCIAIDLPGYGASSEAPFPLTLSFWVESLRAFIEALQLGKPVAVGHSMGAQIAIQAALDYPNLFQQLILVAPAGFERFSGPERQWFQTVITPAMIKASTIEQIRSSIEMNFFQFPEEAEYLVDKRLQINKHRSAHEYYCELIPRSIMAVINAPVIDRLHELKLPTLILFGKEDKLIPNRLLHPSKLTEEVARFGQSEIEGSQLELIPKVGHFVQFEQPQIFNQSVRDFLGEGEPAKKLSSREIFEEILQALVEKDFPRLIGHYAPESQFKSVLWGALQGMEWKHYLEIWMDATQEASLYDFQENKVVWYWKGVDPLSQKELSIFIESDLVWSNDRIEYQSDTFSLTHWIAQTQGFFGRVFGWMPFWHQRIEASYFNYLKKFGH
jgi:pimeloyl-ACP methyl ester carboxylesterase